MIWRDFLDGLFDESNIVPNPPKPVMVCFLNRYHHAADNIKYVIVADGRAYRGTTTQLNYCIEIQPKTLNPIKVSVWSKKNASFKPLDDVIPRQNEKTLVRKIVKVFKVDSKTKKHPENLPNHPNPTHPTQSPAPASSPTGNQGAPPQVGQDQNGAPLTSPQRPVPNEITVAQLHQIFPHAVTAHLQAVVDEINPNLEKYKLDTAYRKANFFGQVRRETGDTMVGRSEDLGHYSVHTLTHLLGYYIHHPQEAAQDHGHAEIIGNKAYGPHAPKGIELGNIHEGDGWLFRGRGMKQVTGRFNYHSFTASYTNYWSDGSNFEAHPDLLEQMPYALRSAIWFWITKTSGHAPHMKHCYEIADEGVNASTVDKITAIVNHGELGRPGAIERRTYVALAYHWFT